MDLSGGQWQRIALARALYAVEAGAGLLVLDEPTSQLDVRGEAAFYDRFLELTDGVTSIVISHRFASVRRADRIAVLDGGRITELGTHEELLDVGGTYASMFRTQAERFAARGACGVIARWRRLAGVLDRHRVSGGAVGGLRSVCCWGLSRPFRSVTYTLGLRVMIDGAIARHEGRIVLGAVLVAVLFTLSWLLAVIGGSQNSVLTDRTNLALSVRIARLAAALPTLEHLGDPADAGAPGRG